MRSDTAVSGYLSYIDGLRAVAVLAVVFYHLDAGLLPGGFTGVDIFFVISGFVVSASVDRLDKVGAFASFLRFYARRLRRIAPALIVCLLATCVFSALFVPEAWLSETSQETGRMAFFGFSNWVLAATGNDYFSPKVDFNAYTHTWSLGVEEQFYFVFPFLFLAWSRRGRIRGLSTALFVASLVASLAYAWFLSRSLGREVEAFYLTTSRFWQLAAGVLLYQGLSWTGVIGADEDETNAISRSRFAALRSLGVAVSVGLVVIGFVWARPGHSPWPDGLWPVLGTMGLLALVYVNRHSWAGQALSLPVVTGIGKISYSLYLWHWPVFVLFRWTIGLESAAARVTALLLAFVLAIASYRLVERPLRHARRLVVMPHWRFVTAAVLVIVASGWTYRYLARHQDDYSLSVVTRNAGDWYPNAERLGRQYPDCELATTTYPVQGNVAWVYDRGGCVKQAKDSRRLFVAGDSHAAGYSELLQRFVLESGRQVTLYAVGGCPMVSLQGREKVPPCREYTDSTLGDLAAKAHAGDVLFLPALRLPRLSEQWMLFDERRAVESMFSEAAEKARIEGEADAVARLMPFAERGVRIVFEAPKPLLRAPPYRCSDWFNRENPICAHGLTIERAYLEHYRAPVLKALSRVAARLPGASVWDPFPTLCPEATCAAFSHAHPLFFDGDHLSGYGNRMLLPGFIAHFDTLEKDTVASAGAGSSL